LEAQADAESLFVEVVNRAKTELGAEHPLFFSSLAQLAACAAAKGEAITAEGLFRSATDGLRQGGPKSAMHRRVMPAALDSFAELLQQLSWNGKRRSAEAEHFMLEAATLRSSLSASLSLSTGSEERSHEPQVEWIGLEPWYEQSFTFDFLGALGKE